MNQVEPNQIKQRMERDDKKCGRFSFSDNFKKIDLFGETVQLTYQGQMKYKSYWGAITTLFLFALVIGYTISQLKPFLNKEAPTINKMTRNVNLNDTEPVDIIENGFNFGVKLSRDLPPSIGYFQFQHLIQYYDYNETEKDWKQVTEITDIELVKCNASIFSKEMYMTQKLEMTEAQLNRLGNFLCPLTKNLTLQGTKETDKFQEAKLSLKRCVNGTSSIICDSNETINDFLSSGLALESMILQILFEELNYDKPLSKYISDGYEFSPQPDKNLNMVLYLEKHTVFLRDSIFINHKSLEKNLTFITEGERSDYEGPRRDSSGREILEICSIYFRISYYETNHERKVQTIGSFLSNIGGFYTAIYFVCIVLYKVFSSWHLDISIARQFYHRDQSSDENRQHISEIGAGAILKENDIESISNLIIGRIPIQYSRIKTPILRNCYRCPFRCCLKKETERMYETQNLLRKELDVVRLLETVREVKTLMRMHFSKPERFLLKFQQTSLIQSDHSEQEDVQYKAYNKLLNSTKESKREQSRIWLQTILMKCFFTRKPLTTQQFISLKSLTSRKFENPDFQNVDIENQNLMINMSIRILGTCKMPQGNLDNLKELTTMDQFMKKARQMECEDC